MGGGSGRRNAAGRLEHGGHWRQAATWPLPDTQFTLYYLEFIPIKPLVGLNPTRTLVANSSAVFGPVALKLRYHLIGSISLLRKTFLHHHRRLPSEG
jgi:hypothetical protein